MNQKWLVLLVALLLCGCRNQQPPVDVAGVSVPAIAVTEPTEPVGFYAPESMVENETDGAVKAFPLDLGDNLGIRHWGEDILLFSGSETTTLTLLSGDTKYIKARLHLTCPVSPENPATTAGAHGITYADPSRHDLVFLNDRLEEFRRIPMPEGCTTSALSADGQLLYYCTKAALRVLDLKTGLDRLLREMAFPVQELTALHCDDAVLQCRAVYDDDTQHYLYFAADTGSLLYECSGDMPLWTSQDFYIAQQMDGFYPQWLTGDEASEPQVFVLESEPSAMLPIPELRSMLVYRRENANDAVLECYQLESGRKLAQVALSDIQAVRSPQWSPDGNTLWFLSNDSTTGQDVLYAWSLDVSAVSEDKTYLQPRWSRDNPDIEGLARCTLLAREMSAKHGVHILIWADAISVQPWDYSLDLEYQVPLLQRRLEELDDILSSYPEGFLEKAASATGTGRLSICLVRSITGNPGMPSLSSAMGLQFWDKEARAYLAITVGSDMAQHLHHELFHIIDSRILSTCNAFDDWNKLNPKGFSYDTQYTSTRSGEGRSFLTEENRYFVDLYSMTYPKEDRARIMEYAMMDDQADLFRSAPMQAKLKKLCQGIRKTFHLEKEPVTYRWEQYLNSPLNPSP